MQFNCVSISRVPSRGLNIDQTFLSLPLTEARNQIYTIASTVHLIQKLDRTIWRKESQIIQPIERTYPPCYKYRVGSLYSFPMKSPYICMFNHKHGTTKVEQNKRWWHKESYLNWKIFASVDDDVSHYQFCTLNHNKNSWGSERKESDGGGGETRNKL